MPLVHMSDLLRHAYREGYAVGAYDLVDSAFLEEYWPARKAAKHR